MNNEEWVCVETQHLASVCFVGGGRAPTRGARTGIKNLLTQYDSYVGVSYDGMKNEEVKYVELFRSKSLPEFN